MTRTIEQINREGYGISDACDSEDAGDYAPRPSVYDGKPLRDAMAVLAAYGLGCGVVGYGIARWFA